MPKDNWKPKARDKSMICRMAGNIAGPALAAAMVDQAQAGNNNLPAGFLGDIAKLSVKQTLAIIKEVEGLEMTT